MTRATLCRYEPPKAPGYPVGAGYVIVLGLVLLVAAIYVSLEFEPVMRRIKWSIVSGIMMVATFLYVIYRWSRDPNNTLRPWDMLLDPVTNKLSLWRFLFLTSFGEASWVLGQWQIVGVPKDADKIIYLIGTVIMGLLVKVMNGEWVDAKAGRDLTIAPTPPAPVPEVKP